MAAGVRTAGSAVISAAESIAARVRSLLHFSVPDEGPLADADTYMPDFMELLAKGITKNEKLVTDAVSQLAGAMGTNLSGPVGNLGGSVEAAFEKITIAIRDSLKSAAGGIEEGLLAGLSGAKDKVGSLWGELADITRGAMDSLTNEVKQGMSGVASAIGELSNQMTSLGSGLSNLGNTIGSKFLVSVGNGVTKVGSIVGSVAGITEDLFEMSQSIQTITGAFQNLDTALSGVAGSSGSLGELGELFQTLISRCGGLGDALSGILSNLGSAGSSGLSGLLSNLGSGIGKTLTGLVSKVGSFGSGLSGIISSIGSALSGIAGSAGSTITGLLGSAGSAIGGFAASAGTALSGVAASAGGLLASAGGALAGLAGPAGIAVAAVGAVGVGIKSLWDNCDSFREGVTNIWDKVTGAVTSGVNAVKGAISTAASAIANGVSTVWSGVKSAASAAVKWGKDICSGIANGIKSAASGVFSAVKNVAKGIADFLHFSVPDKGPLADADTYMPDFMELLAKGIRSNSGSVLDRVRAMTSQIREMVQNLGDDGLPEIDIPQIHSLGAWGGKGGMPEAVLASGGSAPVTTNNNQRTVNMGGIHLTVNGYNVQNDDQLASMVANKINEMMDEDNSVFK